jgi:hypothetical protein
MANYSEAEREQVARAHEKYTLPNKEGVEPNEKTETDEETGEVRVTVTADDEYDPDTLVRSVEDTAPYHEVKNTNDERMAHQGEDHEVRTNAELSLRNPDDHDAVVVTRNRAGVDDSPEDTQGVEDLEMESLVREAAESGKLYETGGPLGDYTGKESLSPYVDGTWLAERSKQTGEKAF